MCAAEANFNELAGALGMDPGHLGHILGRVGIEITPEGKYDPAAVCTFFLTAARLLGNERPTPNNHYPDFVQKVLRTASEMGLTVSSCLDWAQRRFELEGYGVERLVSCTTEPRADFLLTHPASKKTTRVRVYVVLKEGIQHACMSKIKVSGLSDTDIDWYAMVVQPFGKFVLSTRVAFAGRRRSDRKANKDTQMWYSAIGSNRGDFEQHCGELRANGVWWG